MQACERTGHGKESAEIQRPRFAFMTHKQFRRGKIKQRRSLATGIRRTPRPIIVTIRDTSRYIRVLLYSHYTDPRNCRWEVLRRHVGIRIRVDPYLALLAN